MKKVALNSTFLLFVLLLVSCGKSLPTFDQIDLTTWTSDKNGCNGSRSSALESFDQQKEKLLGLSEMQIIELLGTPDENKLYKRNQKFYYYYLQPSANCSDTIPNPKKLSIRFTAMGMAKEVSIES